MTTAVDMSFCDAAYMRQQGVKITQGKTGNTYSLPSGVSIWCATKDIPSVHILPKTKDYPTDGIDGNNLIIKGTKNADDIYVTGDNDTAYMSPVSKPGRYEMDAIQMEGKNNKAYLASGVSVQSSKNQDEFQATQENLKDVGSYDDLEVHNCIINGTKGKDKISFLGSNNIFNMSPTRKAGNNEGDEILTTDNKTTNNTINLSTGVRVQNQKGKPASFSITQDTEADGTKKNPFDLIDGANNLNITAPKKSRIAIGYSSDCNVNAPKSNVIKYESKNIFIKK